MIEIIKPKNTGFHPGLPEGVISTPKILNGSGSSINISIPKKSIILYKKIYVFCRLMENITVDSNIIKFTINIKINPKYTKNEDKK